jgi:dolichol-phosphate mannosyltransferase
MKLSIVIPAYNEEESISETIDALEKALNEIKIEHETLIVNDNSKDNTETVLKNLSEKYPSVKYVTNPGPNGFGYAIRYGLDRFSGDCVAIMMADLSDSPYDLIKFYTTMMEKKVDCVFGSRWIRGGKVIDYPIVKKIINRLANRIIRMLMSIKYNDTTNAFKLYKRDVIEGINEAPMKKVVLIDPLNPAKENWKVVIPEAGQVLESVSLVGDFTMNEDGTVVVIVPEVTDTAP